MLETVLLDSMFFFFRILVLAQLASGVWGQAIIQVDVGIQGSFYNPLTVSAEMGDTIQFVFGGDLHDVTQSSFEEPCIPLPGGFSSGLAGRGSNFSGPPPIWNLEITNVSAPIWFFCGASVPTLHCASGMVGAINPPTLDMYDDFVIAAKNFSPIATASPAFVATGQGAFATGTPSPAPSSISLLPLTTTISQFTTSTSAAPSTTAPSSSSSKSDSHLGPIVGGSVGGAVALLGLIIIILLQRRTYRRREARLMEYAPYQPDERYGTPGMSPTGMSDRTAGKAGLVGREVASIPTFEYNQGTNDGGTQYEDSHLVPSSQPSRNFPQRQPTGRSVSIPDMGGHANLTPNRARAPTSSGHPYAIANPTFTDQEQDRDTVPELPQRPQRDLNTARSATDITIGVLAQEVAKVLMNSSSSPSGGTSTQIEDESSTDMLEGGLMGRIRKGDNWSSTGEANASQNTHSTAPPLYRSYQWEGSKLS